MKALAFVVSDMKITKCILKPIFRPRDLFMQPTVTVWGDHPINFSVKFRQNYVSDFRAQDVTTMDDGQKLAKKTHHKHFFLRCGNTRCL